MLLLKQSCVKPLADNPELSQLLLQKSIILRQWACNHRCLGEMDVQYFQPESLFCTTKFWGLADVWLPSKYTSCIQLVSHDETFEFCQNNNFLPSFSKNDWPFLSIINSPFGLHWRLSSQGRNDRSGLPRSAAPGQINPAVSPNTVYCTSAAALLRFTKERRLMSELWGSTWDVKW